MVDWTGRMSLWVMPSMTMEKGKYTVDECAMYCGDWNGLTETQARCPCVGLMAPKRTNGSTTVLQGEGPVPHVVRGVYASLQELKLPANDPQE